MPNNIFEGAATKTTGAAAGIIAVILPGTLGSGVRMPEVREIGIFNVSGVAAEVGIGIPAAAGTGTLTSVTVQDISNLGVTGNTKIGTSYATTQPTAPSNFFRRAEIQAVVGAGLIWTWGQGEWPIWSGATINTPIIWQLSSLAVTYDVYVKVAE
jgi:hypothetical protein